MHDEKREYQARENLSFADCLKADPFKYVHNKKQKLRKKNIEIAH